MIISDLDEIVSPKILEQVDNILARNLVVSLSMDMYFYDIEHILPEQWKMARIARYGFVRNIKPHHCRNSKRTDPIIMDAGWHMSFFGDDDFIVNKTKNYAHLEAADYFSSIPVSQFKKNMIAVSTNYDKLVFVPKNKNTRLPPRLDILPYQIYINKRDL